MDTTTLAPPAFVPSEMQQGFFNWVRTGRGSAVLIAVAGSGKSTTIVECLPLIPEREAVQILAFNATIAAEMRDKIVKLGARLDPNGAPMFAPDRFRNVRASTFHSLGFNAICYKKKVRANQVQTDGSKCSKLMKQMFGEDVIELYGSFVPKLVSLAKGQGIGALEPDERAAWWRIIEHHDLQLENEEANEEEAIALAQKLLRESDHQADKNLWIDFDDQLYLPIKWRLSLYPQNWVFIDEAQDTNPVRRAIAKKALCPGGRLVAVGDPNQAIYGFCHPAGTKVLTPSGLTRIEDLRKGDEVIIADTQGQVKGFGGGTKVKEVHRYRHSGKLLTLTTECGRDVTMTPHHRVPVKTDLSAKYYTYMMRRNGVYRVGYCKATTDRDFMLTHRMKTEKADTAWLLGAFASKEDAQEEESRLMVRVKGTTFNLMSDDEVATLPSDEVEALKLLAEHGRMVDFPLIGGAHKHRIAHNGPFVTEACNIMDGMRVAFYEESQCMGGKKGRRQVFEWTPCTVSSRAYSGYVYGITVPTLQYNDSYQGWPLYFAGDCILVHNTGASHDAIDLIKREFNAVELPLTVSYRCPKAVGELAKPLVPHFEVHENAIEGEVLDLRQDDAVKLLQPTDAILCRNMKPLVACAYQLLSKGTPCFVLGSEIGKGLVNLIRKMKARDLDGLLTKLEAYREREVANFMAKGEENRAEAVNDRVTCIGVFVQALDENSRTIARLIANIEAMFKDGDRDVLTLSTVHKAKGREWQNVAILEPGLMPSKWARQDWQYQQELNLQYVAYTRAQHRLIFMSAPPKKKEQEGEQHDR